MEQMTFEEHKARTDRSYKLLLWVSMVSMVMVFAGLTSAYVVSKSREDWLKDFEFPTAFFWSTLVIIISSLTFHLAKKSIRKNDRKATTNYLLLTLVLGLIFVYLQFIGFGQIIAAGHYFTGPQSSITTTFLYIVTVTHLAHLFGGLMALLIIIYKHFKQKYNASQTLGIELGAMFWHFLDILWIYLFLFLFLNK
ncbi:cytochrome c oxidase subunit 3 [Flavobacterium branchiophilum]|uniref:Cytochrome c oxidase, subunit III n=2 Tax=Flavobacterium branchiophilum TaxID=55197 RepID=G2Z2S9_FLABF|nr:cytochrome c oxidase subunit 3 [Flavobacterium branchiophilum]PDS23712.1 cytochrome oxidase subunit III [Flavobacterium branchiophilum]CCB70258.1 Cytochrome c oxidase, subunit III [Flavobacterium branchiophilum FL-15]